MHYNTINNQFLDYRGFSPFPSNAYVSPKLLSVATPKPSLISRLGLGAGGNTLSKVGKVLTGAQKAIGVYNQVTPIITQTKPMIDNIRTTFKVAKVFKKMNGNGSLEDAFDSLPDNSQEKTKEKIITPIPPKKTPTDYIDIIEFKEDKKIPVPFLNI